MLTRVLRYLTTSKNRHIDAASIAPRPGLFGLFWSTAAIGAFSIIFRNVRAGRTAELDAKITHKLQIEAVRHSWLHRLLHLVSWPGFPPQSRLLPPGIAAALWLRGFRLEAVFQMLAWGTGGISSIFKRIMQRKRPGPDWPHLKVVPARIGGTSFPSGHVIIYTGVYGFLCYLASLWVKPKGLRRAIVGGLTSMLALVGPSRVYLGHHWSTDVVASYLLGTTYLVALASVYRRVKRWSLRA